MDDPAAPQTEDKFGFLDIYQECLKRVPTGLAFEVTVFVAADLNSLAR